jgi:hypothetical protein
VVYGQLDGVRYTWSALVNEDERILRAGDDKYLTNGNVTFAYDHEALDAVQSESTSTLDHLAATATDVFDNLLRTRRLPLLRENASSGQRNAMLSDALTQAVRWAKEVGEPVVAEDLDFTAKKKRWYRSARREHACSRGCSTRADTVVSPYSHVPVSPWKITIFLLRCLHPPFIPGLKAEAFRPRRGKMAGCKRCLHAGTDNSRWPHSFLTFGDS